MAKRTTNKLQNLSVEERERIYQEELKKEDNLEDLESNDTRNIDNVESDEERTEAIRLNNVALNLLNKKEYGAALDILYKVIKLNPNLTPAYVNLGLINQRLKNTTLALQYYETALKIDPKYSMAHNNIGILHDQMGNHKLAIQFLKKALFFDNKNKLAKSNLRTVVIKKNIIIISVICGLVVGLGIYTGFNSSTTTSSTSVASLTPTQLSVLKTEATAIPYYSLSKFSETYMNAKVTYSGEVTQVIESSGNNVQLCVTFIDDGLSTTFATIYVFYTRKPGEKQILLNDTITLWGESKGLITYKTKDGLITIPKINANIIEVL